MSAEALIMRTRRFLCALRGHRWGRNRAPYLKNSGGFCVCDCCGEIGYVV